MHHFYKNEHGGNTTFVDCELLNPFSLESDDASAMVCKMTITDLDVFWQGTVTRESMQVYPLASVSPAAQSSMVTAALQGEKLYAKQPMAWKVTPRTDVCEVVLLSFWDQDLPIKVVSFELPRMPDMERPRLWRTWLENTVEESRQSKEITLALETSGNDLRETNASMEKQMIQMTNDKISDEITTMIKFKELLNAKKRRIKLLMQKLEQEKEKEKAADPPQVAPRPRKRGRPSHSQPSASSPLPATKRRQVRSRKKTQELVSQVSDSDETGSTASYHSDQTAAPCSSAPVVAAVPKSTSNSSKTHSIALISAAEEAFTSSSRTTESTTLVSTLQDTQPSTTAPQGAAKSDNEEDDDDGDDDDGDDGDDGDDDDDDDDDFSALLESARTPVRGRKVAERPKSWQDNEDSSDTASET